MGYLENFGILPLDCENGTVRVATWKSDPDRQALDDIRLIFDAEIELVAAPEQELRQTIRRVYSGSAVTAEQVIADLPAMDGARKETDLPLDDLVQLANEAPVVKLVNLLLLEALEARASDVHIEAYADGPRVRYRVDGVLQEAPSPPNHLAAAIVSRLKIMAELDIAERRVPQDGRIRLKLQNRQVDVRVSTVPTLHGESVVLRLLDKDQTRGHLNDLGMDQDTLERFIRTISKPHGIVLVTGPTGSGKTTTLYAALERLRTGKEKILTVEDPVEYELRGIAQVPVNEKVGVTFATALRALLRQDPDVILIGEIRDEETAQIATHAALTGHLVLSTLHTNDAVSAVTRLIDLGIAPFLVAGTLEGVLAQRLVRVVCPHCCRSVDGDVASGGGSLVKGTGCGSCNQTGYRGRTGIYELLEVDDDIRGLIVRGQPVGVIRALALEKGMRTLRDDGVRRALAHHTTLDEVYRVTHI